MAEWRRDGRATPETLRSTRRSGLHLFLGAIAVLPSLVQGFTSISTLTIGGTSILIVVSVVLETARKLKSYSVAKSYEVFTR